MAGNFQKEDLRITKTKLALSKSLLLLLGRRSFDRINVNNLCEDAQLSRATFYAHFKDKYDLLQYWLNTLRFELVREGDTYIEMERRVNHFVRDNEKVITNLLKDANGETLDLLYEFMISLLGVTPEANEGGKPSDRYIVLSNFCAGGMVNLLMWQIKNGFPQDLEMINSHFVRMLIHLMKWDTDQN